MFSDKCFGHLISTPFEKLLLVYFCGYLRHFPKQLIVSDKLVKLETLRNLEFHDDQHKLKKKNFC